MPKNCFVYKRNISKYFLLSYFNKIKQAKQANALTQCNVSLPDRKANEGLLALSQEESMPISIRQLAYGTVTLH